jgi:hypothetical protein
MGDLRDLQVRVNKAEEQRDRAVEHLRKIRVAELEEPKLIPTPLESEDRTMARQSTLSVPKALIEIPGVSDYDAKVDEDQNSQPDLIVAELNDEPVESLSFLSDADLSVDPGRVEFRGKRSTAPKQRLDLAEDMIQADLEPYRRDLSRAFADATWFRTRQEVTSFECGQHRGLSRSRCVAELNQVLDTFGLEALSCVMTGNASPDYVHGLETSSLPSHAISLDHGALILCDPDLLDQ